MRISSRFTAVVSGTVLAATLAACGATGPTQPVSNYPASSNYPSYPSSSYPSSGYPQPGSQANIEYGRITNIESVQASTAPGTTNPQVRNAVIGGVIGAVVGSVVGKNVNDGHNRAGATVLGGAAGAALGSQVGKTQTPVAANASYRLTVQTDGGAWRTYEVGPSTGDLRIGDRVRVENGVIYRA